MKKQANLLYELIQKFAIRTIHLSLQPVKDRTGRALEELTNGGMGPIFEEFIRHFSEESNKEPGNLILRATRTESTSSFTP